MKRLLPVICVALWAGSGLRAEALAPADLNRANAHLKKTSAAFLASAEGLSEAQLNFKPGPTRWSVAEVAEHITAAEEFFMGMIQAQVMKAPARTQPVNLKEIDDLILTAIPDRTNKRQAPEPLVPSKRFGSPADTLKQFKASRAKTVAFLNEAKDLRDHAVDSPLGQPLDGYQWVLFISAHSERHTKQIEEVKADANFPKK
jgi:DinB superfamily